MNLWLRMLCVLVASLFRPRLAMTDPSVLRFRVMPHDLDINVHMNNARYLALMDLGRFDLIARAGLWRPMFRKRWQAVIGGVVVRYRRPLKPFQAFALHSRMLCWDERWIYIEHRIEAGGVPACLTLVRAAFLKNGAIVPPLDVAGELGFAGPVPPVPAWVEQWRTLDGAFDDQPVLTVAGKEKTCAR
ncbi:MAG: thioesterase family protein [Magnetospirillum sp.]|nr:thioesterase family protein [Magnetospirillum sp.]